MPILHILAGCESGRAENYAASLILALAETGLEQAVIVEPRSNVFAAIKHPKIIFYPLPVKGFRRLWVGGLLARLKPQLVQAWTRSAAQLAKKNSKPFVVWLAGYNRLDYFPDDAVFVSPGVDTIARLKKEGINRTRTNFIPVFAQTNASPPLDRNLLTTPREAKVILSFSRLHPASHMDTVLTALQKFPEAYVWFAGEGPIAKDLGREAEANNVIDRLRFTGPAMDRNALLRSADVCLLTAAEEPLGTTIAEAWAAGAPLIAASDPSSLTPIDKDKDGLLIPAGDSAALNLALRRLWGDDELRRRLIAQGYAAYIKNYAREAIVRQWIKLYRRLGVSF